MKSVQVSVEGKNRLAKLLAAENLHIEHQAAAHTASFSPAERKLVLPMWKEMSKELYDLFVLHEVGHALYTPAEGYHDRISARGAKFHQYLNVAEDVRIEKKIKRRYPGGRKSFVEGYRNLLERDFFGVKDAEPGAIAELALIDRLNLFTKLGTQAPAGLTFSKEEQALVDMAMAAETFEDTLAVADALWEHAKEQARPMPPSSPEMQDDPRGQSAPHDPDQDDDDDGGAGESGEFDETQSDDEPGASKADETEGEGDSQGPASDDDGSDDEGGESGAAGGATEPSDEDGESPAKGGASDEDDADGEDDAENKTSDGESAENGAGASNGEAPEGDPAESITEKAFRDAEKNLVDPTAVEIEYVTVPADGAYNLPRFVIPAKTVVEKAFSDLTDYDYDASGITAPELVSSYWAKFAAHRKTFVKEVDYLVKEFEMRKAADVAKRARTASTGVLNPTRLASYRWSEDIFLKTTELPEGKSHGLVLFIDWSGSMRTNMKGTVHQLMLLTTFCKKVGIPFDVYAFSDVSFAQYMPHQPDAGSYKKSALKAGDLTFGRAFNLYQLATSRATKMEHRAQMALLMHIYSYYSGTAIVRRMPTWLRLGGTPLHESFLASIPLVNDFRRTTGVQHVNVVYLTDGEGMSTLIPYRPGDDGYGRYGYGSHRVYVDPVTRTEHMEGEMGSLLKIAQASTGASYYNFYIDSRLPNYGPTDDERKEFKAQGCIAQHGNNGWKVLYTVHPSILCPGESARSLSRSAVKAAVVWGKDTLTPAEAKKAYSVRAADRANHRVVLRHFAAEISGDQVMAVPRRRKARR